ncbi:MAG: ABC transporter ATP-binding protein/permease [Cyanobacteria bacterium SZAS LIN-5]|nr:ABC transporter ATP-binding protein/permease [Cyanobacteria bacterium SZAS LIN-5]
MFNRISNLTKPVVWLSWQLIAFAASVLSFGYVDLYKKRDTHGSAGRIWGFFYPFLLSTDKWVVTIPKGIPVPWARRFKDALTPTTVAMPFAWLAGGAAFYVIFTSPFSDNMHAALGQWFIAAEIIAGIAIFRKFWQSLPKPEWQEHSLPLPRFIAGRQLFSVPEFVKAWLLIALSGLGIYLVNMLAVQMNSLNGAFMNSITEKNAAAFTQILWSFATVLGIYTILGPVYSYVKNLLTLEWTMFTTRFMMRLYMTKARHYYPISLSRNPDNPNERIQQDVPAMCSAAMSFMFSIVDSVVTFCLFGHVLWKAEEGLTYNIPLFGQVYQIQHLLLWILIGYALMGSNGVVRVGARLIGLQAKQKQLGADYRVGMVMFEKYAEPIAAYRGEQREYDRLWWRFMLSLKNNYAIVRWQRNLGFFTSGYNQVASLLPYGALAPFYFAGQVAFGTISQAVGAFGEILSSASIFVSQFSALTGLMASVNRVGELRDELERLDNTENDGSTRINIAEDSRQLLDIDNLTLFTPDREKIIIKDFSLHMVPGRNVAIVGESGSGKTSLLRSIVGLPLWNRGEGNIRVPGIGERLMLTQLAYLPMDATLRDQIQYPSAQNVSDEELIAVLKQVNLPEDFVERVGGLDSLYNWDKLSGGERQRLVVARALINKVRLVIADEATSGLDAKNEENLYQQMIAHGMTLLSVTHKPGLMKFHHDVVQLLGDGKGGWRMRAVEAPGQ